MTNKEELAEIRQNLVLEAADGLAKHHKAQGAIQLLDYLLEKMETEKGDGPEHSVNSGRETGDNAQESLRDIPDSGGQTVASADGTAGS